MFFFFFLNLFVSKSVAISTCSIFVIEIVGLRLGSIGMFCLAFLFLPVARGSILLRMIDIPFEHATRYHVWLGHLTMIIFTLHGLFFVIAWSLRGDLHREVSLTNKIVLPFDIHINIGAYNISFM